MTPQIKGLGILFFFCLRKGHYSKSPPTLNHNFHYMYVDTLLHSSILQVSGLCFKG